MAGSAQTYQICRVATGELIPTTTVKRHKGAVFASAFHPAGQVIATGGSDGDVRLVDVATGQEIGQPLLHASVVWSVSFAHDGRTLLTSGEDKTARIFSLPHGYAPATFKPHGHFYTAAVFGPRRSDEILTSGDGFARRWNAVDGHEIDPIAVPRWKAKRVLYRPDNQAFLTLCEYTARLWDPATGSALAGSVPMFQFSPGSSRGFNCAVFSHDGKTLLTGGSDRKVRRWDATTGRFLGAFLETTDEPNAMAVSPDGKEIVTGDWSGHIYRWEMATGRQIGESIQHGNKVNEIAYSPDGKLLLTGGDDGQAQLWRVTDMKRSGPTMRHLSSIRRAKFSPDGRHDCDC